MVTAVRDPQKDGRYGKEHAIGVLVYKKKGGDPPKKTKDTYQTRQETSGGRRPSVVSGAFWFHLLYLTDYYVLKKITSVLLTENKYPRTSDCIGGLPQPGLSLHYTLTNKSPAVSKYTGNWPQDPIPFAILDELHNRYLVDYPEGLVFLVLWFSFQLISSKSNFDWHHIFSVMTGSMLSYTDRHASYAIREILEWGFKTLIFLDPFQDLKKEHGEQSIQNLAAYITQV